MMTADYEGLATELLRVNEELLRLPDHQQMARLSRGSPLSSITCSSTPRPTRWN